MTQRHAEILAQIRNVHQPKAVVNAMRGIAATKTNFETKLAGLQQQERQLRPGEITDEIIELAVGAKAIKA